MIRKLAKSLAVKMQVLRLRLSQEARQTSLRMTVLLFSEYLTRDASCPPVLRARRSEAVMEGQSSWFPTVSAGRRGKDGARGLFLSRLEAPAAKAGLRSLTKV